MRKYRPTIGIEIHIELATASKMFCGCPAEHFGVEPNTRTCPVCLGLPGALPVPNTAAIEDTIKIGLALNCEVQKTSKFDRKQYFYPDLPKGYQISQYDEPLSLRGYLDTPEGLVRIRRVHLEEDTGKLLHKKIDGKKVTLVDFNRSGVPLVEIVTEPDMHSAFEAKKFSQKLRRLIRWLGVSGCDMEKGSMRLEANISLSKVKGKGQGVNGLPDYKVEVKNINSFRFLEKAIDYEIERQTEILKGGGKVRQETRGWDEAEGKTKPQRYKETEADYRYFPEPDIPPMEFKNEEIRKLRDSLPELPQDFESRFRQRYKLPLQYIEVLLEDKALAEYADKSLSYAIKARVEAKDVASAIVNRQIDIEKTEPGELVSEIKKQKKAKVTGKKELAAWIDEAINLLPQAAKDYRKGKREAIQVLIGKVIELSRGKADPVLTRKLLEEKLNAN